MDWKEKLANKRLIFTVTSGRSGTHFLTRLFNYLPGLDVFHEESEHSYHHVLRANQLNPNAGRAFIENEKLPFILSCKKPVFVETSHLICKGFLEHFLDLGLVPDIVLLSRNRRKIATSLYRLNTIPGRNEKALNFYLSPGDRDVFKIENWETWTDYQLCYWHVLEIERRQRYYGEMIRALGGRVHACDLDDLTTVGGFKKLANSLDLKGPSPVNWIKFFRSKRIPAGDFTVSKNERALPTNQVEQESEIEVFFESLDKGH